MLMPLLGTTWVLGLLSVNSDTVVFQYLFAIVNSLQVSSASGACTQIMAIYKTIYLTVSKFAAKLYFCLSVSNFGRVVWIYVASGAYLNPSEKPYMRRFFYSSQIEFDHIIWESQWGWPSAVKKVHFLPSTVKNADWHRQKVSILLSFPISADRNGFPASEESSSKLENQLPCTSQNTPSRHYKTLEPAYI